MHGGTKNINVIVRKGLMFVLTITCYP